MTCVWDNSIQKGSALLVLLSLADNANEENKAWPSIPTIAKKTRLTERYVQSILRKIADDGELMIVPGERYGISSNTYIITVGVKPAAPVKPAALTGEPEGIPTGEPEDTPGVKPAAPKPSVNHQSFNHQLTIMVEYWHSAFPHKRKPRIKTKSTRVKVKTRLKEKYFVDNWKLSLERASKSTFLQGSSWFTFGWFVKNQDNYLKMLDGNYDDNNHRGPANQNQRPQIKKDKHPDYYTMIHSTEEQKIEQRKQMQIINKRKKELIKNSERYQEKE